MAATSSGEGAPAEASSAEGSLTALGALLVAMRPKQWIKNLVLPLPFLFGRALQSADGWFLAAAGVAAFSAIASGIYLVNDIMDRERDRAHPEKRHRPLASGRLSVSTAAAFAVLLVFGGLGAACFLRLEFGQWCTAYAILMIAYSLVLKRVPFLEALIVAAGMPLRALAGAALAAVWPSQFLLMCAYLLALFLVAGKRQWEYHNAGTRSSAEHRPALAAYRAEGLDHLFIVTGLATASAYSAYSVFPSTAAHYGGRTLAATIPFVVFGLARYVHLVYRRGGGGNPTQALLVDDPWLLVIVMGWVVTAGWIIYGR
ncbi:MAG TPA: UbiA prenyltransferase family protein [Thermoanaerobaculia bacterium]|nr:UbiA prenyltransferase family protein [Thermoanaerobaculia bacterium]